jgi:hypothetical protein
LGEQNSRNLRKTNPFPNVGAFRLCKEPAHVHEPAPDNSRQAEKRNAAIFHPNSLKNEALAKHLNFQTHGAREANS